MLVVMVVPPISTTHHIRACVRILQDRWDTFPCRSTCAIKDMEHGPPQSVQGSADLWNKDSGVGATPLSILQCGIPDCLDVHRRTMAKSTSTAPRHDATHVVVELNGNDTDPRS